MKIGIDLSIFRSYQGIEVYAEHMIRELVKISDSHLFFVFVNKGMFPSLVESFCSRKNVKIVLNSKKREMKSSFEIAFYQQFILPFRMWSQGIETVFSPSVFFPIFASGKKVIVIHDCAYKKYKEFKNILSEIYIRISFFMANMTRVTVMTVSEFSKRELVDLYQFREGKIKVVYEGVPVLEKVEIVDMVSVQKKFSIHHPFFLSVGSPRPRKNIERILLAFKQFHEMHPNYQLVILGKKDKTFFDLETEIERLGLTGAVIETGFVSNKDKSALYSSATALLYPSLYEGFGLPVLEAQYSGIPVITSNNSSLPEIGGDGALYIDAESTPDIVRGMIEVMNKNVRKSLALSGQKNVTRFSWSWSARELLELLTK